MAILIFWCDWGIDFLDQKSYFVVKVFVKFLEKKMEMTEDRTIFTTMEIPLSEEYIKELCSKTGWSAGRVIGECQYYLDKYPVFEGYELEEDLKERKVK